MYNEANIITHLEALAVDAEQALNLIEGLAISEDLDLNCPFTITEQRWAVVLREIKLVKGHLAWSIDQAKRAEQASLAVELAPIKVLT